MTLLALDPKLSARTGTDIMNSTPPTRLGRHLSSLARELGLEVEAATLAELEWEVAGIVPRHLGRSRPLRPSALARELEAMAKGLERAARAAERMGDQGMVHVLAASLANRSADSTDPGPHVAYLRRMARRARRAADIGASERDAVGDSRGGRTPDFNLRDLITLLMDRFQEHLALRPTHTVDSDTGLGVSAFDRFVKEAIATYAPPGVVIEPRKIDDAILSGLDGRDFVPFMPPPFTEP